MLRHTAYILIAAAILLCVAPAASALPPAGAYPSREIALDGLNADEEQALDVFQRVRAEAGLQPMVWNASMSAVAREHSEDMAADGYCGYYSDKLGTLEYRLHRAGVSSANARYAVFRTDSFDTFASQLRKNKFAAGTGTHLGLGAVSTGVERRMYYVTLIIRQTYAALDPFPTLPIYGKSYRLSGAISPGLSNLKVVVTLPDGIVRDAALELDAQRRFATTINFNRGAGLYMVELTASGDLGPLVLELMRCYAGNGRDYPPPDPADRPVKTPTDMRQAERMLLDMVNRARAAAALPPLKADEPLAAVARAHSDDMRRNNFFAHISPTRGDLSARAARAGIKARRLTENIAINPDLVAAHRSLMDSPGHRKNILDPEANSVGIGIVMGEPETLFITENFRSDFISYDTGKLGSDLLKEINAVRAKEGLPQLRPDDGLRQIANLNSAWMVERGKPGYDKAKEELGKARLNMTTFRMAVSRSADPPGADLLGDEIRKDFQRIGISILQVTEKDGEKALYTTVLLGGE